MKQVTCSQMQVIAEDDLKVSVAALGQAMTWEVGAKCSAWMWLHSERDKKLGLC